MNRGWLQFNWLDTEGRDVLMRTHGFISLKQMRYSEIRNFQPDRHNGLTKPRFNASARENAWIEENFVILLKWVVRKLVSILETRRCASVVAFVRF